MGLALLTAGICFRRGKIKAALIASVFAVLIVGILVTLVWTYGW